MLGVAARALAAAGGATAREIERCHDGQVVGREARQRGCDALRCGSGTRAA
jgi:hypothetical protein